MPTRHAIARRADVDAAVVATSLPTPSFSSTATTSAAICAEKYRLKEIACELPATRKPLEPDRTPSQRRTSPGTRHPVDALVPTLV
jgi:hypothetical protein